MFNNLFVALGDFDTLECNCSICSTKHLDMSCLVVILWFPTWEGGKFEFLQILTFICWKISNFGFFGIMKSQSLEHPMALQRKPMIQVWLTW